MLDVGVSITGQPVRGAGGGGGSFYPTTIDQSLRFNDNDSAYLSRTFPTAGNRKIWTWSGWVKRGNISLDTNFMLEANSGSGFNRSYNYFSAANEIIIGDYTSVWQWQLKTNALYRDPSAWYHIVVAVDTTQATASNRIKLYVNGEQVTSLAAATYPSQNYETYINSVMEHTIGYIGYAGQRYFDGYMAEVHFTDGTAYTADDFGEFKNGVWVAKTPSVTYGTNGFYLDFANSGSLGTDSSGNANNWSSTNLAATDQMLDSPTNNFATLNPLGNDDLAAVATLSEGNTIASISGATSKWCTSTIYPSSGKYYVEVLIAAHNNVASLWIGAMNKNGSGFFYQFRAGTLSNISGTYVSGVSVLGVGDIIGIAIDVDNDEVSFYANGVLQGTVPATVAGGEYLTKAYLTSSSAAVIYNYNFGQDSSFAGNKTPQGNTDANGIGDFYYPVPTGALALCTSNLPNPAISPADGASPTDYMNTVLYTGTGAAQTIGGVGFQPDLSWFKCRSVATSHELHDVIRGTGRLSSNLTDQEYTTLNGFVDFDVDGFDLDGAGSGGEVNTSGRTYVAWNWLAGGTPVSNTDGTITSSVSANTTSGFSIVSYTGTGANGTVGHGLSQAPEFIITKDRDQGTGYNWNCWFTGFTSDEYVQLSTTIAKSTGTNIWNTLPTSSVFGLGTAAGNNASGDRFIAYCFHSVDSFSKCGSYVGNGSADGTFVFTGHQPSWILVKRTDAAGYSWTIFDSERNAYNVINGAIYPNDSAAENTATDRLDFLSNGFKWRTTNAAHNASGGTYIFLAFAENPFKYSNAR